jgi:hypothetical protein
LDFLHFCSYGSTGEHAGTACYEAIWCMLDYPCAARSQTLAVVNHELAVRMTGPMVMIDVLG